MAKTKKDDDEEEEDETEKEESIVDRGLSLVKEDLVLFLITLIGGIAIGYFVHKMMDRREDRDKGEHHHHHYHGGGQYQHPMHHFEQGHKEQYHHHRSMPQTPVQKQYDQGRSNLHFNEEEGEFEMERPMIYENWVVKRDLNGNITDAYKPDGEDWLR